MLLKRGNVTLQYDEKTREITIDDTPGRLIYTVYKNKFNQSVLTMASDAFLIDICPHEVFVGFRPKNMIDDIIMWIRDNLSGRWSIEPSRYIFRFGEETDAMAVRLRWSKIEGR